MCVDKVHVSRIPRYNDVCIFNDYRYNDVVAWQMRFFSIQEVSMSILRTIMSFKFYDASDLYFLAAFSYVCCVIRVTKLEFISEYTSKINYAY